MIILLSGACFFGARALFMASAQINREENRNNRVYHIKTFWNVVTAAFFLFSVGLARIILVCLGTIENLTVLQVSWGWFALAAAFAYSAYSLNKKIKAMPRK
jgi:hypothetical protein